MAPEPEACRGVSGNCVLDRNREVRHEPTASTEALSEAETAQQEADDEGLAPLLAWVKGALDRILRQCFAAPDLEFHWLLDQDEDNLAQAQMDQIYLSAGVKSINEVRAEQGLAPAKGGELPLIVGAGLVTLDQAGKTAAPAAPPIAKYSLDQPRYELGRMTQTVEELIDNYMRHVKSDYVGLWQIAGRVRDDLHPKDDAEAKKLTLEIVRGIVDGGLLPGEMSQATVHLDLWSEKGADAVVARINRERTALGHDPDLADPICWFERPR